MDSLSEEEHRVLRNEARRFLEAERPFQPNVAPRSPDASWDQLAALGWLGAIAPESAGGFGGLQEAAILTENLGRNLSPEPLDVLAALVHALGAATTHGPAAELAGAIAAGEVRPALARPAEPFKAAPLENDSWRLDGEAAAVWGCFGATHVLVPAQAPTGLLLACLSLADPGVDLERAPGFDNRETGRLRLTAATATALIHDAEPCLALAEDAYRVLAGASALGGMDRALELTCEYLQVREQFGQRLSGFQALRHALADGFIELELARSMLPLGLEALDAPRPEREAVVSALKVRIGQAGLRIGAIAVQLHGGIGVTVECEVGHHYRRLLAYDLTGGSQAQHLERHAALKIR